ncbi:MAG: HsdM family class I SAM-dependent methyltransferase [Thermodesulfobacteriota bacterium]
MDAQVLIQKFGYADSPAFLHGADLDGIVNYAHVFRKARNSCGLQGVYTLRNEGQSPIPLVYVCEIDNEEESDIIHRRVWNQDIVPFLMLVSPYGIRVYSGFDYADSAAPEKRMLDIALSINEALGKFQDFQAESIDNGNLWKTWGHRIRPENRVDWKLLGELEGLGKWLISQDLDSHTANALVGKYVFLRYLKDRDILSPRRLAEWNIPEQAIFGREASLKGFQAVNERLKGWLNGDIFSIDSFHSVTEGHIQKTAAVFNGDEVSGQMHLGFKAYDFSYIPLETLSVIYEQFLHAESLGKGKSKAEEKGAYYTPVHLVNFMLDELESRHPLGVDSTVLDPACGSGAFLVQAYRRMIEQALVERGQLRPVELRELLTRRVFGIDQDPDACQVAGLSLALTLLDYVDPPDLGGRYKGFKLPELQNKNILCGDFFDPDILPSDKGFHWIASNPPWQETRQKPALEWMKKHKKDHPVGRNQLAEAFAWKVLDYVRNDGAVGMLMPAMSLFKSASVGFRKNFFQKTDTRAVVNFANLASVLFAGRAQVPAASFFYAPLSEEADEIITVFSPFRITQPATRSKGNRESWAVTVNGTELRRVRTSEAAMGDALTWKLALWGTPRDGRLLERISDRFSTLAQFAERHELAIHQGIEIRFRTDKDIVPVPELTGKKRLLIKNLPKESRLYTFPQEALEIIPEEERYTRKGRDKLPLQVSRPPHLIVDVSRRFAVFSNEFIAVPARQIGIAGAPGSEDMLKTLAFYVISNFARYFEFFLAAQIGVQKSISNLATLNFLPVPDFSNDDVNAFSQLYDQLAAAEDYSAILIDRSSMQYQREKLEKQANERVYNALGLSAEERILIRDLIYEKGKLLRGKVSHDLLKEPSETEIRAYIEVLKDQLDDFLGDEDNQQHAVTVVYQNPSAMLEIRLVDVTESDTLQVHRANTILAREFAELKKRLTRQHSQWLYFERNLTVFDGDRTYLFKPLERLSWLQSQALTDATDLIAQTLCAEPV